MPNDPISWDPNATWPLFATPPAGPTDIKAPDDRKAAARPSSVFRKRATTGDKPVSVPDHEEHGTGCGCGDVGTSSGRGMTPAGPQRSLPRKT